MGKKRVLCAVRIHEYPIDVLIFDDGTWGEYRYEEGITLRDVLKKVQVTPMDVIAPLWIPNESNVGEVGE